MSNNKMSFKDAPVGARFRYPNSGDSGKVWVKINSYPKSQHYDGKGLICSWHGNIKGQHQEFCLFSDEENGIDFNSIIELL